jgi:hypothetical protein
LGIKYLLLKSVIIWPALEEIKVHLCRNTILL